MARVFIPRQLQPLTGGHVELSIAGATLAEVLAGIDQQFPGFRQHVCDGDRLRPGLAATADGQLCTLGLRQPLAANAELHFLPSVGGG